MKISIASYSFHGLMAEGKIDVFGYLESCRYRYGLQTADLWNGLLGSHDAGFLLKVRQAAEERDLEIVNYHVDGVHLWEEEPEKRERNYRLALEHLKAAAILGAKTVRFDTGGKVEAMTTEQLEFLATRYREYCQFAHDHGFVIGPENHWGLSLIPNNMIRIAEAVASPSYGILLHIGHWEEGDPREGDEKLAKWTAHTHIDANITRLSLNEAIVLLQDSGFTGCLGVEHHTAKNEYAEVGYQVSEVRRVLKRQEFERHLGETAQRVESRSGNPLLTKEQETV